MLRTNQSLSTLTGRLGLALALILTFGSVPLRGQDSEPVVRSVSPPGVSCSGTQTAAATSRIPDSTFDSPPLPIGPQPKPRLALLPVALDETLLRFVVDKTGSIDPCSFQVLRETSRLWTSSVVEALVQWRFRPARRDGHPVRFRTQVLFKNPGPPL